MTVQWGHMSPMVSELTDTSIICQQFNLFSLTIKQTWIGVVPSKRAGNVEIQCASEVSIKLVGHSNIKHLYAKLSPGFFFFFFFFGGGGGGAGGVSGTPNPGDQPPYPRPIFCSLPPPPFYPYFLGYSRPKIRFFAPPPPIWLPPPPIFRQSPRPPPVLPHSFSSANTIAYQVAWINIPGNSFAHLGKNATPTLWHLCRKCPYGWFNR